jgi:phenylalanyl-tRNA synthetase beta chain
VRIANPLSAEEPYLRSTLLADLVTAARRNVGRGFGEMALFESGRVFRWPQPRPAPTVVRPGVAGRPSDRELAELDALLPAQPEHVAVLLTSSLRRPGWWGPDGAEPYRDAIATARMIADEARLDVTVVAAQMAPWHPGRCAELRVGDRVVGWAGELHPRVLETLGLPDRAAAMELNLEALDPDAEVPATAPSISAYPAATQDLAFVLDASTTAADLEAAIRAGAGSLLEDVRLFDVYTGDQVGSGRKSLAYHLRLRAPDRTLTAEEVAAVRAEAVAEVERRTGATLR